MRSPDRLPGLRARLVLLLLLLAAFPAGSVGAPGGGAVTVDLGVVLASQEGTTMDPALSSIQSKLRSMFTYSSYRMLDRQRRDLSVGQTGEFPLPGNRSMRVTPSPPRGKKIRLAVEIREGGRNLLSTTLGLSRGGMVLVGGPSHQNGVLILILSAE
ncbi:MAG: hypothetical protein Kow00128_03040 [Deltaproteobacteria bacterium]